MCHYGVDPMHLHLFNKPKPIVSEENDQQIRDHVRCTVQVSAMT